MFLFKSNSVINGRTDELRLITYNVFSDTGNYKVSSKQTLYGTIRPGYIYGLVRTTSGFQVVHFFEEKVQERIEGIETLEGLMYNSFDLTEEYIVKVLKDYLEVNSVIANEIRTDKIKYQGEDVDIRPVKNFQETIEETIIEILRTRLVVDGRSPKEYESAEGVTLGDGVIYFQVTDKKEND